MGKIVRKEQFFDAETVSLAEQLARKGYPPEHYVEIWKKERLSRTNVTKWIVWEEETDSSASVTDTSRKSA